MKPTGKKSKGKKVEGNVGQQHAKKQKRTDQAEFKTAKGGKKSIRKSEPAGKKGIEKML